jgi:putative SOS response-associated peptidase YedK
VVPTYTIITTTATDSIGRIHDRMPMAIAPDHWAEWLDPRNHVDLLRGLIAPPTAGSLDMYAVSKAVNSVKNNGAELLEPLPAVGVPQLPRERWWRHSVRLAEHGSSRGLSSCM